MAENRLNELNRAKVVALIVCFYPDQSKLNFLINAIAPQVSRVLIADNGGAVWLDKWLAEHGLTTVERCDMNGNVGIGAALNILTKIAVRNTEVTHVLTFDQDSQPPHQMVDILMNEASRLESSSRNVAAVGPAFFDPRSNPRFLYPFYKHRWLSVTKLIPDASQSSAVPCDLLITSGMLVSARALVDCGGYDEGLFVDYTDTEWCFRAISKGWSFFGIPAVKMPHELSDAPPVRKFGVTWLSYSPKRRYLYVRNTFAVCKRRYVPFAYKFRLFFGVLLRIPGWFIIDSHKIKLAVALLRAVYDSFVGRFGPIPPGL